MPPEVMEFNHFHPSDWLIRNPTFLVGGSELNVTLDRFKEAFKVIKKVLNSVIGIGVGFTLSPVNCIGAGASEGHQQAVTHLMILKTLTIHLETFQH